MSKPTSIAVIVATCLSGALLTAAPAYAAKPVADTVVGCTDVQPPAPPVGAQHAASHQLDKVAYLQGDWAGTGWSAGPDGVSTYVQHERIRRTAADTITVDGTGTNPANPAQVVFSAHATLTWAKGAYAWTATSDGNSVTVPFTVTRNGWAWSVDYGGGVTMRYEMTTDATRTAWDETGFITTDGGATWRQVMGMHLTKTCSAG